MYNLKTALRKKNVNLTENFTIEINERTQPIHNLSKRI